MSKTDKRKKIRSKSKPAGTPAAFLVKTYEILENPIYNDIVSWNREGNAFVVKNVTEFSDKILPKYFKHNNFASFVRQLNMYDFHKSRQENNENEFRHKLFKRGHKNLLADIKRKTTEVQQSTSNQLVPVSRELDFEKFKKEAGHFSNEMKTIKGRQSELEKITKVIYSQNTKLLKENKLLWGELIKNKEKYEKKIEKLMMFVFSVMQYSGNNGTKAIEGFGGQRSLEAAGITEGAHMMGEMGGLKTEQGQNVSLPDKKDHETFFKQLGQYFQNKGNKTNLDSILELTQNEHFQNILANHSDLLADGEPEGNKNLKSSLALRRTRGRGGKAAKLEPSNESIGHPGEDFKEMPVKHIKLENENIHPTPNLMAHTTPHMDTHVNQHINPLANTHMPVNNNMFGHEQYPPVPSMSNMPSMSGMSNMQNMDQSFDMNQLGSFEHMNPHPIQPNHVGTDIYHQSNIMPVNHDLLNSPKPMFTDPNHHFMGFDHHAPPLSAMPSTEPMQHHQPDMMHFDLSKQDSNPYLHHAKEPQVLPNQDPLSFLALSQQNSSHYNQPPIVNTFNYPKEAPVSMLDMQKHGPGQVPLLLDDDAERRELEFELNDDFNDENEGEFL